MESYIYFHAPVIMLGATQKTQAWECQAIICTSSNQSPAQMVIIPLHSKSHWAFGYLHSLFVFELEQPWKTQMFSF